MSRIILISLFLLSSFRVLGQFAIINDIDGYTNVRKDKSSSSEIIGRLFNDDVFLIAEEDDSDEWINVFYFAELSEIESYKKDYYLQECHCTTDIIYFDGYVHKSRVLPIEKLVELTTKRQISDQGLSLMNDSIIFSLKTIPFIQKNHKVDRVEGWVEKIDGNRPKGVDGGIPKVEIKNLSFLINSGAIEIPKQEYADLFEPNLKTISIYADKRGVIYVYMPYNSDGAGGYDAVWIIKENQYLKRYVDTL